MDIYMVVNHKALTGQEVYKAFKTQDEAVTHAQSLGWDLAFGTIGEVPQTTFCDNVHVTVIKINLN